MSDGAAPGLPGPTEIVPLLHAAARRVTAEQGTPAMDSLAVAGALFLRTSDLQDHDGTPVALTVSQGIGYGVMLGWLARESLDQ